MSADFVLIGADHPSKLIRNLPKMIRSECQARLIGFSHTNTRSAINTLSEMHFEHAIRPPFTGTAVECMVKDIMKDEFAAHEANVSIKIKAGLISTGRERQPLPDQKTKFAELTQRALDASVTFIDAKEVETLGTNKRFACLFVKSFNLSGYLIAALGKDRVVDAQLMADIRNKLFQSLRAEGNDMFEADPIQLELHEVQIENWAMHEAKFLAKAVHQAQEIAVAFFENDSPFEISEVEQMMKMKIEELDHEVPVDFDLYVYLPVNDRLIKITHKGRSIQGEQQERLMTRGLKHLHIHREDFSAAFQYAVGSKLSRKIRNYQSAVAA